MKDHLDKTDEELLREFRLKGDPSFLNTLFSRYVDVGFRTAMRYTHNETDAEDALQTAFILFLENIESFREGASTVKPWLMKIIVNACLCKLREEKRRSRRQQVVAVEKFNEYEKNSESSHMSAEQEELKDKIKNAVETLPEKYRSPIWLVLYEGFSYSEVATVLAMPETTVRTQVARGLKKLRELLEPLGLPLSASMIINLMAESKLEAAPATIKNELISSVLHKSISAKPLHGARRSSRLQTQVQPSVFSFKFVLVAIGLLVAGGLYILNQKAKQTPDELVVTPQQKTERNEEDINKTWVFANEADRNLQVSRGSWGWSEKHNGMAPPVKTQAFVVLPFSPHEKCIVVEVVLMPLVTRSMPNLEASFDCFWVKDQKILKHQSSKFYQYVVKENATFTIKSYLYQNYVCALLPDKSFNLQKFPEDLSGSNITLLLENYAIQKISCYTINDVPKDVQHAIEKFSPEVFFEETNLK